ncbi:MAG TPA: gephyrin-like molybdotransferase Glp [Candidatus Kapabacteria bacterium]|jgi:molybdopterin molybdotransferase|nr:gephyrin-like molybdotransferase Glp [Candidatus Kapabacteria bacterium]
MISFTDARRIIQESATREMSIETVPLVLAAGRVLAHSIVARESVPPSANSAMDGYAVVAADTSGATVETPVLLSVIDEASAGSVATRTLGPRQAIRIMTGGLIPEGADAVVEVESTSEADGVVAIARTVRPGEAVREPGDDMRAGETVIDEGKRLTPGDIGVLATLGIVNVPVRIQPKVGILATGNEIVEPWRQPAPGQLRNSSAAALYAFCAQAGAEPIDLGIARDDRDELAEKLEGGLRFDVLLTTGGVSAGLYDYVQHLLPAAGVDVRFHTVNIKPGKPVLFGVHAEGPDETLVFGLPGNPVSTLVTFHQFVRPAICALMRQTTEPLRIAAALETPLRKSDDKRHFVRGVLRRDVDGALKVASTGSQSSGAMSSMSRANCLIVLAENERSKDAGEMVEVEML